MSVQDGHTAAVNTGAETAATRTTDTHVPAAQVAVVDEGATDGATVSGQIPKVDDATVSGHIPKYLERKFLILHSRCQVCHLDFPLLRGGAGPHGEEVADNVDLHRDVRLFIRNRLLGTST